MCDACGMLNSYISSNQRNLCKVRLLFHHVTHDEDRKKAGFVDHKDYRACLCAETPHTLHNGHEVAHLYKGSRTGATMV